MASDASLLPGAMMVMISAGAKPLCHGVRGGLESRFANGS